MSLTRKLLASCAGVAALLALAVPAIAGTVVASTGPSAGQYRVGAQIAGTQRITLRAGDSVTVLENGGTRVLRGPGTFMLTQQSGQATNNAFAALTSQRAAGRARTGAVRGPGDAPVSNPNLWYVDIARSGTVCLANPASVLLWRGDATDAATLPITAPDEEALQANFPATEILARWDPAHAPREGVTYRIGTSEVSFKFLADMPADPEALAQALIANGCMLQLEQLAAATLQDPA